MHVLVTGHEGYIGSALIPLLLSAGHTVTGIDAGYYREASPPPSTKNLHSVQKDIRDLTSSDLFGVAAVIHLAALSNDPLGNLDEAWTYQINHQASVRLASLAKLAGAERFLFSSSCSVYGLAESQDLVDENSPVHPLTPYALSKVRVEAEVSGLADEAFSPVYLRNATAYGWSPRFRADLVLNNLACWAYTTREVRILSDGTPWRPLVHVQDIARAFLAFLEAPREHVHNRVLNIGANSQNYQVRDLAGFVQAAFPSARVAYAEGGEPDPRSYRVDFSRLKELLPGFRLEWDAASGARQLYQAYQRENLTAEEFTGPRYTRLARLKELLAAGELDGTLRWRE
jgi:nucleoside-diphosphate-sugar epimerase